MAFGQFGHAAVLIFSHEQGQVHIGGDLPSEGFVQQVVFGGGGEVLAAPHHVGDMHQVVINDIGEVISGIAVGL